jgi:1-acyl-sn-glycerol-3-phosphate acyltransferase
MATAGLAFNGSEGRTVLGLVRFWWITKCVAGGFVQVEGEYRITSASALIAEKG